jgi:hypothetical protein
VRFTVVRGGRELRGFRAFVPMLCPGVTGGRFTTQIATAAMNRLKVAPDGSFVAASTSRKDTAIRVRGRLRSGKASGVGDCTGSAAFSAARAR